MILQDFIFPITERAIAVHKGQVDFVDSENNNLISIVRKSYQIVPMLSKQM